jgi:hypothetical protein
LTLPLFALNGLDGESSADAQHQPLASEKSNRPFIDEGTVPAFVGEKAHDALIDERKVATQRSRDGAGVRHARARSLEARFEVEFELFPLEVEIGTELQFCLVVRDAEDVAGIEQRLLYVLIQIVAQQINARIKAIRQFVGKGLRSDGRAGAAKSEAEHGNQGKVAHCRPYRMNRLRSKT